MIQIRQNVFETNSSSAHTIAIKKNGHYDYKFGWKLNDGILWFSRYDLDFGRSPFDVLATTEEKFPYFIAVFGYKKISKIILDNIPEVKEIEKPKINSEWDDPDCKEGIDHQSIGMLESFIKKNNLTIEEVLFNDKYIIIIDGDEYNTWHKIINLGIVDKNNFEELDIFSKEEQV